MKLRLNPGSVPGRIAAEVYILHAGIGKWSGSPEQAAGVHGMAARAFPFLKEIPSTRFLRWVAAAELGVGGALLTPVVPDLLAGAALTAFSGGLVAMYGRTPALHKRGSVWPSPAGTAVSKDVWLLGIGLGLLASARVRGRN